MKPVILFVGILAMVAAADSSSGKSAKIQKLEADITEFFYLMPFKQINDIISEELVKNKEFYTLVEYLQSDGLLSLLGDLVAIPEFDNFVTRLETLGVDFNTIIDLVHSFTRAEKLNVSTFTSPETFAAESRIGNVVDKILAVLPLDKFAALFVEKYEHSKVFRQLINEFRSDEFFASINKLNQDPDVQELLAKAADAGIQIEAYVMEFYRLFKALIGIA